MKTMKVYYVANFYMPFQKAYAIQLAKMCEALVEEGVDLTLLVPHRGPCTSIKEFFGLRVEIPTRWLPVLDLDSYGPFGYVVMAITFMISSTLFLWYKRLCGEHFVIYTIDADRYSSSALALVPAPIFSEMHGAKPNTFLQRVLFSRLQGVIAINRIIVEELERTFPRSETRYIAEPNGVDLEMFAPQDKIKARQKLGLPDTTPTILYAGRFYDWKGLEILPRAARLAPHIRFQMVGGTKEEFVTLTGESVPDTMYFAGGRPHAEMSSWIAAADAVLVLGTKRDEQSYRWTSPMKLFEYMAAGRPIVASATPAIKDTVSLREVFLYEPDNAEDLVRQVQAAVQGGSDVEGRVAEARKSAQGRSWNGRAGRVLQFIESTLHELLR